MNNDTQSEKLFKQQSIDKKLTIYICLIETFEAIKKSVLWLNYWKIEHATFYLLKVATSPDLFLLVLLSSRTAKLFFHFETTGLIDVYKVNLM